MTRETKVGLVVAGSFVCLVGGVFATKYLHGPKPEAGVTVAQSSAQTQEKSQPAGEELQTGPPLYKPAAPAPGELAPPPSGQLEPKYEPSGKRPAAPPADLAPLDLPGTGKAAHHDDPAADDIFNPGPTPTKPQKKNDGDVPPLTPLDPIPPGPAKPPGRSPGPLELEPIPSGPAKPSTLGPLELEPIPSPPGNRKPARQNDPLSPPSGGIARVGNPPKSDDPLGDLPLPGEKKDEKKTEKKDEKNDPKLPVPSDPPPLDLPAPMGGAPALPAPGGPTPPPMPKNTKPSDGKNPTDLPPPVPKSALPSDVPASPAPKLADKPRDIPAPPPTPKDNPAASLTRPTSPANDPPPPEARVDSYDEEWYYCKQGDSLDSISQKFFFTPKYDAALRQYNLDRNYQASFRQEKPSLAAGQVVKVPPARILEKLYPATLPGFRPTSNQKPDAGGSTTIPPTGSAPVPGTEDLGQPRDYTVPRDGMTLRDIAKEELKDVNQWTRIFNLNREWNPSAAIPRGTHIAMPRAQ
jgi:hypothetical protein